MAGLDLAISERRAEAAIVEVSTST